jgi:hypothetical protein
MIVAEPFAQSDPVHAKATAVDAMSATHGHLRQAANTDGRPTWLVQARSLTSFWFQSTIKLGRTIDESEIHGKQ